MLPTPVGKPLEQFALATFIYHPPFEDKHLNKITKRKRLYSISHHTKLRMVLCSHIGH
jgi:hypothetical protein